MQDSLSNKKKATTLPRKPKTTSWEKVKDWYDSHVGESGHYYHQHVILPHLMAYWKLRPQDLLLDLACGQGVLSRHIPKKIPYVGVDISQSLIQAAKKQCSQSHHKFVQGNIEKPLAIEKDYFTHAALILALQNLQNPEGAFSNAATALKKGGYFSIVINHPCFRIPRQSSWGVDNNKKLQYRRVDSYMSTLHIPIYAHPGKVNSEITHSFHWPLSQISIWLEKNNFSVLRIEELCSDKESHGKNAKMENRARKEFPLFLVLHAKKNHFVD